MSLRRVVREQSAGLILLLAAVIGGVFGAAPDLSGDGEGDVPVTLDFRSLYAAGLQWLEVPAGAVLPGAFEPAPLFRA